MEKKILAVLIVVQMFIFQGMAFGSHTTESSCESAGGTWDPYLERCFHCGDDQYYDFDSQSCVDNPAGVPAAGDSADGSAGTADTGSSDTETGTDGSILDGPECSTDAECGDNQVCDTSLTPAKCHVDCGTVATWDAENERCLSEKGGSSIWEKLGIGAASAVASGGATGLAWWFWPDSASEQASAAVNDAGEAAEAAKTAATAAKDANTAVSSATSTADATTAAQNALDAADSAQDEAATAAEAFKDVKDALKDEDTTTASKALIKEAREASKDAAKEAKAALESAKTAVDSATQRAVDEAVTTARATGQAAEELNTSDAPLDLQVHNAGIQAKRAAESVNSNNIEQAQQGATYAQQAADRARERADALDTPEAQAAATKAQEAATAAQAAVDAAKAKAAATEALSGSTPNFGAAKDALESLDDLPAVTTAPTEGTTSPGGAGGAVATGDESRGTSGSGSSSPGSSWTPPAEEEPWYAGTSVDDEGCLNQGMVSCADYRETFQCLPRGYQDVSALESNSAYCSAQGYSPDANGCINALGRVQSEVLAGASCFWDTLGGEILGGVLSVVMAPFDWVGSAMSGGGGGGGDSPTVTQPGSGDCGSLCISTSALTQVSDSVFPTTALPSSVSAPETLVTATLAVPALRGAERRGNPPRISNGLLLPFGARSPKVPNEHAIYIRPCQRVYHLLNSGVLNGAEEIVERYQHWFDTYCGFLDVASMGEPSGDGCALLSENINHVQDYLNESRGRGADERAAVDEEILAQLAGVFETSCTDSESEDSCIPLLDGDGESQGIVVTSGEETTLFQNQCLDMNSDPDAEDPVQVIYACDGHRMTMDSFTCSKCTDHSGEELTMCRVREAR